MTDQDRYAKTQHVVASHFGVHVSTVRTWRARAKDEHDVDFKTSKGWDLEVIQEWRDTYIDAVEESDEESEAARKEDAAWRKRKTQAEAREKEAKAAITEHKMMAMTSDLVHLDEVEAFLSSAFTDLRRQLDRLPVEYVSGYAADMQDDMKVDLKDRIDLILSSFHGWVLNAVELRDDIT